MADSDNLIVEVYVMFICGEFIRSSDISLASYDGEDIKLKLAGESDFYYLRAKKEEWEKFAEDLVDIESKNRHLSRKSSVFGQRNLRK